MTGAFFDASHIGSAWFLTFSELILGRSVEEGRKKIRISHIVLSIFWLI